MLTTNSSGKRSLLNRSPTFLVPLEVGPEYLKTVKPVVDTKGGLNNEDNNTKKGNLVQKTRFLEDITIPQKKKPLEKGTVVLRRSCRKGERLEREMVV